MRSTTFALRRRRALRWAATAATLPGLWGCTSRTVESPTVIPTATLTTTVTQKINDNIERFDLRCRLPAVDDRHRDPLAL
jgi:hypothetical protein